MREGAGYGGLCYEGAGDVDLGAGYEGAGSEGVGCEGVGYECSECLGMVGLRTFGKSWHVMGHEGPKTWARCLFLSHAKEKSASYLPHTAINFPMLCSQ